MFFKRMEMHGFKSFGHKIAVDFQEGVTIVVGPNGCGKSNVLDSIRWVLGETSAKSLRGAKMGDVIFRGASSLKPASFAQVNLIVDNSQRLLPLDQSEVMVTRRLFSNGDSEYMINKQKCRMRDVHELFMDTGLGADGYSVIEQGQIGMIVAAKPSERREIFEEAAGISRYKARREETVRKLVRTEEDLIRLFDIVAEVEKTTNSLYRQAKKAERHRKLTRRADRAKKRLIVLRHRLLSEKLHAAKEKTDAARNEFEAANTALAQAEARRAEASRQMEEYQKALQELQQEKYDLQNAVNREQRQVESANQALEAIAERAQLLDREITAQENRVTILADTIKALDIDLQRERAQMERDQAALEEKSARLETLRRENDQANSELSRLRAELESRRGKANKVTQDRRFSEQMVERLSAELAQDDEQMERLRTEAQEAAAEAQAARDSLSASTERLASYTEERATLEELLKQSEDKKGDLDRELDKVTKAYNQRASRLQALQELEDSYEGFFRGVQVVMKASQQGKLNGIYGVLTKSVTVPKEYEAALETAFGGSLQDIITYTEEDAREAIEFLKHKKQGRATFLPLSHLERLNGPLSINHLNPVMGRNGVIGLAKELIQYDPVIEPAIIRRLGSTLVVEELRTALDLQRQGVRNRYVSLDGQLADPSGVMSGGSHQSRGLLTRSREINELRREVEELDAQRRNLQERLSKENDRLSQSHARLAELQTLVHQEQMAEARHEKDLQSAEARDKDRRNTMASAEARLVQQRHDLAQHKERLDLCDQALEELNSEIARSEAALAEAEGQAGGRGSELETLAEEVSEARAAMSGLKERVNGLSGKLDELRRDQADGGGDQSNRREERAALDSKREKTIANRDRAEKILAQIVAERDAVEQRVNALVQENEEKIREARKGVAEIQQYQRDRNQKENALREVENQVTELKAQTEYLREEVREEFQFDTVEDLAASLDAPREEESDSIVSENDEEAETPEAEHHEEDEAIEDTAELRRLVNELQAKIQRIGPINETAIEEYKEIKERLDFLTKQRDDLIEAKDALQDTIEKLDETTTRLFHEAFEQIQENFQRNFRKLFNGGKGELHLVDDEKHPEPGIEIWAQPPGKNIGGSINLMSGGEKAMTAICLMLSLFEFKPSPICILDEIDAPLDDVNCQRLSRALKEMAKGTQFLIITHNKITMGLADTIYGVTMQEPGISKVVSVKFDNIDESGLLEGAG